MPTINPVSVKAHERFFIPNNPTRDSDMRCAAPLDAITLPSMAPNMMTEKTGPRIAPTPFSIDFPITAGSTPNTSAATTETIRKDIKGCILAQVINNTNNNKIPSTVRIIISQI